MQTLPIYQVDAFTDEPFAGNPAAVVLLDAWIPDSLMQAIAAENNLAETAFVVTAERGAMPLRWFTPTVEAPFCGHATLAAAHVLNTEAGRRGTLSFDTRAGVLRVTREDVGYVLDLPATSYEPMPMPPIVTAMFGAATVAAFRNRENVFVELADERLLREWRPDFARITELCPNGGLCITARSGEYDFVSRYFAPADGIPEDAVTGSTHATLVPYWGARLGRSRLLARQCSPRGGTMSAELAGHRVRLGSGAVTYLRGTIDVPS
jgi:PhzF family phenazine biosynthesis protein